MMDNIPSLFFYIEDDTMAKKHNRMLKYYGKKETIEDLFDVAIRHINLETPLRESFSGCRSYKEPDITAISYDDVVYIGELKGNFNYRALDRARNQIQLYLDVVKKLDYEVKGVIIVGDYKEFYLL